MRYQARFTIALGVALLARAMNVHGLDPRPELPPPPEPVVVHPDFNGGLERQHVWSYYAVDSILRHCRPTVADPIERKLALFTIDEALHYEEVPASSAETEDFLRTRLQIAVYEMENTQVTEGAVIWQLYNHAFVVRTASLTLAFDLTRNWYGERSYPDFAVLTGNVVDQCDALFISHNHSGHTDEWVKDVFLAQDKPVIASDDVFSSDTRLTRLPRSVSAVYTVDLSGSRQIEVIVFPGHEGSTINNVYLVSTPEQMRFAHTGDQDEEGDYPWIDEVGSNHQVDVLMLNGWSTHSAERFVSGFDPEVAISGHENDLGHDIIDRKANWLTSDRLRNVQSPVVAMDWGESYYYEPGQPDAGNPAESDPQSGSDPRPGLPAPPDVSVVDPSWDTQNLYTYCNRQHEYSLQAVDTLLRQLRPGYPDPIDRRLAMVALDEALHYGDPNAAHSVAVRDFLKKRLEVAVYELDNTTVTRGAVIWKLYNHAFVVRTPTVTFAFDLTRGFSLTPEINTLTAAIADHCDALFVSHEHGDHQDAWVMGLFYAQLKPVITTGTFVRDGMTRYPIALSGGRQLEAVIFPGYQISVENNVPLVLTPEGMSFSHTGDLSGSFMFWWIDHIKDNWDVDILMVNNWTSSLQRTVRGFDPEVVLTGHENEVSHPVYQRMGNYYSYDRLRTLEYPSIVMTWGESFYYVQCQKGDPPEIYLMTTSFTHLITEGARLADDSFTVANSCGGVLTYSMEVDAGWLSTVPDSGTSAGEADLITIVYDTARLEPGTYNATITITDIHASNSPQEIPVTLIVEPLYTLADFDHDGDVDMEDFGHLQVCLTGPGVPQTDPACEDAMIDSDDDVDQDDFGLFQACISGANVPAPSNCVSP
jgi:beta-lactamase superfamily II metal-dependent hydrolase